MKTIKKMLMLIMVLSMVVTTVPSTVEAKAKAYKMKTVKVTEGKEVTVKTKKKIKSVKVCSKDKTFEAEKCGSKKFYVAWTTYGVKQTVKVKYTNGRTQKFNIKTVPDKYGQKIVNELKPLLADPDEGLKKIIPDLLDRSYNGCTGSCTHRIALYRSTCSIVNNGCIHRPDTRNAVRITDDNIIEVFKDYSDSEKQAFILTAYMKGRMNYTLNKKNTRTTMKDLYNGTFNGKCDHGAEAVEQVCRYLGIKTKKITSIKLNHSWCCMYVKDKDGNAYWKGIAATAYAMDMKSSMGSGYNPSIAKLKKQVKDTMIELEIVCSE